MSARARPRRISRQKFPKRTRILSIPSKPYFFHSAIGSRMNRMTFRSFRKRNSSQKNTNTVYSGHSYSGIVPNAPSVSFKCLGVQDIITEALFGAKVRVEIHGLNIGITIMISSTTVEDLD